MRLYQRSRPVRLRLCTDLSHDLPDHEAERAFVRMVVCDRCDQRCYGLYVPNRKDWVTITDDGTLFATGRKWGVWAFIPGKLYVVCKCGNEWSDIAGVIDDHDETYERGVRNILDYMNR